MAEVLQLVPDSQRKGVWEEGVLDPQYRTKDVSVHQEGQEAAHFEGVGTVHREAPGNFDKTPGSTPVGKPYRMRGSLWGLLPVVPLDLRPGPMGPEAVDLICGRANFLPDFPSNTALHKPRLRPVDNNAHQAVNIPVGNTPARNIHTPQ